MLLQPQAGRGRRATATASGRSRCRVSETRPRPDTIEAPYFIDATELGDLLPLARIEYVTGAESRQETGELHAPGEAQPDNHQAFTVCFPIGYDPGDDHTIDKPDEYDFWRDYVPALTPPWPGSC